MSIQRSAFRAQQSALSSQRSAVSVQPADGYLRKRLRREMNAEREWWGDPEQQNFWKKWIVSSHRNLSAVGANELAGYRMLGQLVTTKFLEESGRSQPQESSAVGASRS